MGGWLVWVWEAAVPCAGMLPTLWSSVDEEYCHRGEGVLGRMVGRAGVGSGEGGGADGMQLWRGEALLSGYLFPEQLAERGWTQRAVFLPSRLPLGLPWWLRR